jgi:hypothetical protein
MTVYANVSGLATWGENCKWYSSLPLGAVVSLVSSAAITLCVASQRVFIFVAVTLFRYDSVRKLLDTPSFSVGMNNTDMMSTDVRKL